MEVIEGSIELDVRREELALIALGAEQGPGPEDSPTIPMLVETVDSRKDADQQQDLGALRVEPDARDRRIAISDLSRSAAVLYRRNHGLHGDLPGMNLEDDGLFRRLTHVQRPAGL